MEFEYIKNFFISLDPLRHKYRILGKYIKHVTSLDTDKKKDSEVECMKQFLINNPRLNERIFDDDTYRGTKPGDLYFKNISIASDELINIFWENIFNLERILFPNGKPEKQEQNPEITALLNKNPILGDLMSDLMTSDIDTSSDITSIIGTPAFSNLLAKIQTGFTSGKYKLSDLTKTVTDVAEATLDNENDINPDTRKMFTAISDTMQAAERGETPNLANLINIVGQTIGSDDIGTHLANITDKIN